MQDLYAGKDPEYDRQMEQVSELELLTDMQNFVGYKLVSCCQNCHYRKGDQCFLLQKYNGRSFTVVDLGKCKHYKRGKEY